MPDALDDGAEVQVYRQWRRGIPVAVLSQQQGLAPTIIERMINKMRAQAILERPLEYMYHPSFDDRRCRRDDPRADARGPAHGLQIQAAGRPAPLPGQPVSARPSCSVASRRRTCSAR